MLVSDAPALRRQWYPVTLSTDVTDQPRRTRLFGTDLVVWRVRGGVHAAVDRCPHRGAALSNGWLDGDCLVCPYHAWSYGTDGRALRIPQLDDGVPIPPKARLDSVLASERYGYVWAALDQPVAEIPDFHVEGPGWRLVHEFFEPWAASAPRIIDNSLDIAHTAVVHRNTVGDFSKPKVRPYEVERTDTGLRVRVPVDSRGVAAQGAATDDQELRDVTVETVAPLAFVGRIVYGTGLAHVICTIATPLDAGQSMFVQFVARNDPADPAADAAFIDLDRRVTLEDQAIVECTDPDLPLDVTREVHLRCDRVTLEYRRYLADVLEPVPA
jgi:phenylpropionate dioxygenase-like ring-hydroxylating dioxygenase large terminal subunit